MRVPRHKLQQSCTRHLLDLTASVQVRHARVARAICAGLVSVKEATLAFLCHLLVLLEWAQGSWRAKSAVTVGCGLCLFFRAGTIAT